MCDEEMEKCAHGHHDHHGPHGHKPHGHGPGRKKEVIKTLNPDCAEALFFKTAHKLIHQSDEDIENQTAFAALSPEETEQLKAILAKLDAAAKAEKPAGKPEEAADAPKQE